MRSEQSLTTELKIFCKFWYSPFRFQKIKPSKKTMDTLYTHRIKCNKKEPTTNTYGNLDDKPHTSMPSESTNEYLL